MNDRLQRSAALVPYVSRSLTERDLSICRLLEQHRVLTTEQLSTVFFDSVDRARDRLRRLWHMRVLDRFQRSAIRMPSMHYVLGEVGSAMVAIGRGEAPPRWTDRPYRSVALASSTHLAHLVGVNGVFCDLIGAARRSSGPDELEEWWSEARATRTFGSLVQPDGYGVWRSGGNRIRFCLEYDRSTEPLNRLAAKLPGYSDLAVATGLRRWVLFSFATPQRERRARAVLQGAPIPVATAERSRGRASEPVWWPVGEADARVELSALAGEGLTKHEIAADHLGHGEEWNV